MREKEEVRYTMKEVSEATGIKCSTLQGRRKRLGIEAAKEGYTLEEIKRIIKRPPQAGRRYSQRKVEALRQQLKNDGAI